MCHLVYLEPDVTTFGRDGGTGDDARCSASILIDLTEGEDTLW